MKNFINKCKELGEKKAVNITFKIVKAILIVMFIAFMLMVLLQRVSNNQLTLFNVRMFTVVSGSMEPKYNIGDVLISKEVKPDKIKVGDTISYQGQKGSVAGKIITHQVESISVDATGKYIYKTKGLANDIADIYPVSEDQVYGVIVYKVKILSFVYKIVGTKIGLFFFVIVPLMYIIGSEVIELMLDKEEKRRAKINS